MTDEDVIARVAGLLGTGYYRVEPKKEHWKASYRCALKGIAAISLMSKLRPEMGARRQQQIDRAMSSFDPTLGKTLLNVDSVAQIRRRLTDGSTVRQLSQEFGVTISTIYDIKNRRSWRS